METCAQVLNWFQMNVHRKVQGCVDARMVVLPVLTCSQKKAVHPKVAHRAGEREGQGVGDRVRFIQERETGLW